MVYDILHWYLGRSGPIPSVSPTDCSEISIFPHFTINSRVYYSIVPMIVYTQVPYSATAVLLYVPRYY